MWSYEVQSVRTTLTCHCSHSSLGTDYSWPLSTSKINAALQPHFWPVQGPAVNLTTSVCSGQIPHSCTGRLLLDGRIIPLLTHNRQTARWLLDSSWWMAFIYRLIMWQQQRARPPAPEREHINVSESWSIQPCMKSIQDYHSQATWHNVLNNGYRTTHGNCSQLVTTLNMHTISKTSSNYSDHINCRTWHWLCE